MVHQNCVGWQMMIYHTCALIIIDRYYCSVHSYFLMDAQICPYESLLAVEFSSSNDDTWSDVCVSSVGCEMKHVHHTVMYAMYIGECFLIFPEASTSSFPISLRSPSLSINIKPPPLKSPTKVGPPSWCYWGYQSTDQDGQLPNQCNGSHENVYTLGWMVYLTPPQLFLLATKHERWICYFLTCHVTYEGNSIK